MWEGTIPPEIARTTLNVHNVFHVSQLKRCLLVPDQVTDFEGVRLEPDLTYSEYLI
jgi:hypothetical protein